MSAEPSAATIDHPPEASGRRIGRPSGCQGCAAGVALFPFTMAFQPIVDLAAHRIDAYEALVRGPNGEGAASVLSRVTSENVYAFDQACRVKAIELASRLGIDCQLNINFLPNAVYEPRACIRATLEATSRCGFDARRLTFEIVETETLSEMAHLTNIVAEYHRHGFKVALDDFTTGYSGLSRLAELQPDIVKLDRVLVKDCDQDHRRLAILANMLNLGRDLGIKMVLEGVERTGEVDALRSIGARFIQGFHFGRPLLERLSEPTMVLANA